MKPRVGLVLYCKEALCRLTQGVFGGVLFEIPGLRRVREAVYCLCFHIKQPVLFISKHVTFSRNHLKYTQCKTVERECGTIAIGHHVAISADVRVDYTGVVSIGNHVDISEGVRIFTHKHKLCRGRMTFSPDTIEATCLTIDDGAWIGAGAIILPSVNRIGRNVVIGAGSVVTKDVPDNMIVAGNPAVPIRSLTDDEKIECR